MRRRLIDYVQHKADCRYFVTGEHDDCTCHLTAVIEAQAHPEPCPSCVRLMTWVNDVYCYPRVETPEQAVEVALTLLRTLRDERIRAWGHA